MYPYLIQGKNIIVVVDNVIHTLNDTHLSYDKVLEAIKKNKWDVVKSLVDVVKSIEQFSDGNVKIIDDKLYWNSEEMRSGLSTRVLQMFKEGFDISNMIRFLSNLMQNPSKRAINQLYDFMDACSLPITPDGHFLAYKRINENYTDCHTGKIDNSIGKVVEMERKLVNDNADDVCSTGLHFCSASYLNSFPGARLVVVKINPKDVVSIPVDYSFAKGRCCRYEVISEIGGTPEKAFTKVVQENCNEVLGQEYDSKGNALSMTPNAIRKRAAKAKKAAAKAKKSTPKVNALSMTPNAIRKRAAKAKKAAAKV